MALKQPLVVQHINLICPRGRVYDSVCSVCIQSTRWDLQLGHRKQCDETTLVIIEHDVAARASMGMRHAIGGCGEAGRTFYGMDPVLKYYTRCHGPGIAADSFWRQGSGRAKILTSRSVSVLHPNSNLLCWDVSSMQNSYRSRSFLVFANFAERPWPPGW